MNVQSLMQRTLSQKSKTFVGIQKQALNERYNMTMVPNCGRFNKLDASRSPQKNADKFNSGKKPAESIIARHSMSMASSPVMEKDPIEDRASEYPIRN